MDVTIEFLNACSGAKLANGFLTNSEGNWWVHRLNRSWALMGIEGTLMTDIAADVLTDPTATTPDGIHVNCALGVFKLEIDSNGFLDAVHA